MSLNTNNTDNIDFNETPVKVEEIIMKEIWELLDNEEDNDAIESDLIVNWALNKSFKGWLESNPTVAKILLMKIKNIRLMGSDEYINVDENMFGSVNGLEALVKWLQNVVNESDDSVKISNGVVTIKWVWELKNAGMTFYWGVNNDKVTLNGVTYEKKGNLNSDGGGAMKWYDVFTTNNNLRGVYLWNYEEVSMSDIKKVQRQWLWKAVWSDWSHYEWEWKEDRRSWMWVMVKPGVGTLEWEFIWNIFWSWVFTPEGWREPVNVTYEWGQVWVVRDEKWDKTNEYINLETGTKVVDQSSNFEGIWKLSLLWWMEFGEVVTKNDDGSITFEGKKYEKWNNNLNWPWYGTWIGSDNVRNFCYGEYEAGKIKNWTVLKSNWNKVVYVNFHIMNNG